MLRLTSSFMNLSTAARVAGLSFTVSSSVTSIRRISLRIVLKQNLRYQESECSSASRLGGRYTLRPDKTNTASPGALLLEAGHAAV